MEPNKVRISILNNEFSRVVICVLQFADLLLFKEEYDAIASGGGWS